jgi:phosphoglycolate phosphatase-like HAD superfamily hydrolase
LFRNVWTLQPEQFTEGKETMNYVKQLKALQKQHEFFIGFDSDGCVFDTMSLKHKECFCPAVIKNFRLQSVSNAARDVWEFVNLYSKTRGYNRFAALQVSRNLLRRHPDVTSSGFTVPALTGLDKWIEKESKLGNPALTAEVEKTGDPDLKTALTWSLEVNERVADLVFGVAPFPCVMDVLSRGAEKADMIVVSQTPLEALEREWKENEMTSYVNLIAGQEHGTKAEHIHLATEARGYGADHVLKVGDAPGDYKAAQANNALFYPIIPGRERDSWKRLKDEGLDKFFDGTFAGAYQNLLMDEFDAALPDHPAWESAR